MASPPEPISRKPWFIFCNYLRVIGVYVHLVSLCWCVNFIYDYAMPILYFSPLVCSRVFMLFYVVVVVVALLFGLYMKMLLHCAFLQWECFLLLQQ